MLHNTDKMWNSTDLINLLYHSRKQSQYQLINPVAIILKETESAYDYFQTETGKVGGYVPM